MKDMAKRPTCLVHADSSKKMPMVLDTVQSLAGREVGAGGFIYEPVSINQGWAHAHPDPYDGS